MPVPYELHRDLGTFGPVEREPRVAEGDLLRQAELLPIMRDVQMSKDPPGEVDGYHQCY